MGGNLPRAERRGGALVALYVALSLLLWVVGERVPQPALRGIGGLLFSPLDRVVLAADRAVAAWVENRKLHGRIAELEIENAQLKDAADENRRLRDLLGFAQASPVRLIPAEILTVSGEPVPSSATLDVGSRRGVRVDDAVITREGLLGRVAEVHSGDARVVLLTDLNSAVACAVETTGVQGVLHFTLSPRPRLVLTLDPFADSVRVGEQVLTSGLSRRFPRGLRVGQVSRVGRTSEGLAQEVEVRPAVRWTQLRHAFVLPRAAAADRP